MPGPASGPFRQSWLFKAGAGNPGHQGLSRPCGYGRDTMKDKGRKGDCHAAILGRGYRLGAGVELEVAALIARRVCQLQGERQFARRLGTLVNMPIEMAAFGM